MTMLNGIQNLLTWVNNNWTSITVIIGLCILLWQKIKAYIAKSNEEKIEVAKAQIKVVMLKLITDAEVDYEEWNKAGSIKRAQVIQKILDRKSVV